MNMRNRTWPARNFLPLMGIVCGTVVLALLSGPADAAPGPALRDKPVSLATVNRLATTAQGRSQLSLHTEANGTTCINDVYITSYANTLYVSAELGWTGDRYGILRARASEVGPWELFQECWYVNSVGKYVYTLQSQANGKYVSVEYNYKGNLYEVLRARASTAGEWEHFYMGVPENWHMDLQAVRIGRYVSVEIGNTGDDYAILRARATDFGPWEDLGQA